METFDSLLTLPLFVAQHHTAQKRCTITYYKNRNEGKEKKKGLKTGGSRALKGGHGRIHPEGAEGQQQQLNLTL